MVSFRMSASAHALVFSIADVTSEDESYGCAELLSHRAGTKGWSAAMFCEYPQTLTLKIDSLSVVSQLQILSHQSRIASRVEIYAGIDLHMRRLGYISFDTNERTGFKARELKTVQMNVRVQYIKLVLHKCHINKHNIGNQVGLVAINIIGYPESEANMADFLSPSDAPDEFIDENIVCRNSVTYLEKKKAIAVQQENYDLANKLKTALQSLRKIVDSVETLEESKKAAVDREDFNHASLLKRETDQLKRIAHQQMNTHGLLVELVEALKIDHKMAEAEPNPSAQDGIDFATLAQVSQPIGQMDPVRELEDASPIPQQMYAFLTNDHPFRFLHFKRLKNPTGRPQFAMILMIFKRLLLGKKKMKFPIIVFGERAIDLILSKVWNTRLEGVELLIDCTRKYTGSKANLTKAVVKLYPILLKDTSQNIIARAIDFFAASFPMLEHSGDGKTLSLLEVSFQLLIARLGDSNSKTRESAHTAILQAAKCKNVGPDIFCRLIIEDNKKPNVRLIREKLLVLCDFIKEFGLLRKSMLNVEDLMEFGCPYISHASEDIRSAAVQMISEVHVRDNDGKMEVYLKDMKPIHLNMLRVGFLKADVQYGETREGHEPAKGVAHFQKIDKTSNSQADGKNDQGADGRAPTNHDRLLSHPVIKDVLKKWPSQFSQMNKLASNSLTSENDNICSFCSFTPTVPNEDAMYHHQVKDCPMLYTCERCKQIVEISNLSHHRSEECEQKSFFAICPNCMVSIPGETLAGHALKCTETIGEKYMCPLCLMSLRQEEWEIHLLHPPGCPKNPRTIHLKSEYERARISLMVDSSPIVTKMQSKAQAPISKRSKR